MLKKKTPKNRVLALLLGVRHKNDIITHIHNAHSFLLCLTLKINLIIELSYRVIKNDSVY